MSFFLLEFCYRS